MATKATTTAVETAPLTTADLRVVPLETTDDDIEITDEETAPLTTADLINLAILSAKNQPLETQIVSRLNEAKQFLI
jgi:hypothetical protein